MADPVDSRGLDPRTGSVEGETPERPAPQEAGTPGTPGEGQAIAGRTVVGGAASAHDPDAAHTTVTGHAAEDGHAGAHTTVVRGASERDRTAAHTTVVGDTAADGHAAAHTTVVGGATDHAPAHGDSHDEHADAGHDAHGEPRVGPIDWPAWGASALGIVVGVVIAALFYLAVAAR
jgi:hypothetical protein